MTKRLPMYYSYRDVPADITYPSAWRQRGYAVKEGSAPVARLIQQIGLIDANLPLYSLSQCRRLAGPLAKRRRQVFLAALQGEEE